ncbi:MAG: hypothetical protein K8S62_04255 [Candidatus Sabulitectum sp.]|nr:hypothetical protein [Candidatus Sabulitectum sp.]
MTTEMILRFGQPVQKPVNKGIFNWLTKNRETGILKNSGLSVFRPGGKQLSLFTCDNSVSLWTLAGFRDGRYVKSTVMQKTGVTLLSSIASSIPVFFCCIRKGIPMFTKSPVSLPLNIIRSAGTFDLASDGTTLFSSRICRFKWKSRILRQQLEDVCLLESVIESL